MSHGINTATPIGCLAGFFAVISAGASAIAFWGAHKAFTKQPALTEVGDKLTTWGIVFAVPAAIGILFCIYRFLTMGGRDHVRYGKSLSS